MKRILAATFLTALVLAASACGVVNTLTGGAVNQLTGGDSGNMKTVAALWSDVPKMDGLTPSQMDMPLPIKLVMRTVIGNLGRLNQAGEDQTTGNIDWIVFTSSKTAADVQNFYTNKRMTANGWEASDQSTCTNGSDAGITQAGVLCAFQKQQGDTQTELLVIAAQDDQTKQTNVFFLRLEVAGTPTPSK